MNSSPAAKPGRGHYDRAASASERAQRARAEILTAVRELLTETAEHLAVKDITARAGIGRNTFYGHFTDLSEAVRETGQRALAELTDRDVEWVPSDETPRQALERFVCEWFRCVARDRATYRVARSAVGDELGQWLSARLTEVHAVGARAGLFRQSLTAPRVVAALGMLSALGDHIAEGSPVSEECEWIASEALALLFR